MLQIGQTSHTLFADESDIVIPWTALASSQSKIVLTDLLYPSLEIYNILVCNTNFLLIYIHTIKICGGYMEGKTHFLESS
jgi:hypothetical protein